MKKSISIWVIISVFCISSVFSQTLAGIREYKKGNFDKALWYFQDAILNSSRISSQIQKQLFWYGKTEYQLTPKSTTFYSMIDSAYSIDPNNFEILYFKTQVRNSVEGLNDDVLSCYKKVYAYKDISSKVLRNISSFYVFGYETTFDEYIDTETNKDGPYYYSLATIMAQLGREEEAFKYLVKSFDLGYKDYEFIRLDFYPYRFDTTFHNILDQNDVPGTFVVENSLKEIQNTKLVIQKFVEGKINEWQKKGKFEKTSDYRKRVNTETRTERVEYYTQSAIDSIGISSLNWYGLTNEYDADNESFKITFPGLEPLYVKVPIDEAPSFDENFNDLEFSNMKFTLSGGVKPYILHLSILNSNNGLAYIFDSQDEVAFNSAQFDFSFDKLELSINDMPKKDYAYKNQQTTKVIHIGKSDVDINIPISEIKRNNTYALIVGNEDYTKFQNDLNSEVNVDYAKRDAEVFAQYAEKTLGIPKGNITLLTDAISSQMNREIEKLSKLAKYSEGEASIIFYFAGHGFPDERTKEAYIMPVDISGVYVQDGIKLADLYSKLTTFPSKKVIVILDACFSGGGRNQGLLAARGVAIKPKPNNISGNLVVFSSSSGEQSSLPYHNKQHGMFTYFFLKKLKETQGEVSLEELKDYVTKEVQINALKMNNKEQNPNLQISPTLENAWMDWKL